VSRGPRSKSATAKSGMLGCRPARSPASGAPAASLNGCARSLQHWSSQALRPIQQRGGADCSVRCIVAASGNPGNQLFRVSLRPKTTKRHADYGPRWSHDAPLRHLLFAQRQPTGLRDLRRKAHRA
jgi:hypothetical protein